MKLKDVVLRQALYAAAWCIACELNAQPGTVDSSFGNGGVQIMPHPEDWLVHGYAFDVDSDGRCLVVGGHGVFSDHYLARVLSDGAADASFSSIGYAAHSVSPGADWAKDVELLDDGRFVTAGSAGDSLCVVRYLSNGDLDLSFGSGGSVRIGTPNGISWGCAIVSRPDGRLLVSGRIGNEFGLAQFTPDGVLDAGFGIGGLATIAEPSAIDMAYAMALRTDGSVLAAGRIGESSFSEILLAQFLADGTLDPEFGDGGQLRLNPTPFDDIANDIVLAPGGGAIICGEQAGNGFVARISSDGTLDASFGDQGIALLELQADSTVWLSSLVIQPDGKIVAAGSLSVFAYGRLALVRLLANGSRDPGFGINGIAVHDILEADGEGCYDLVLSAEGSIMACGIAQYGGEDRAILARFLSGLEVGISEHQQIAPYRLFSNAPGMLEVRGAESGARLTLFDAQGRLLRSERMEQGTSRIPCMPGLCFWQVEDANGGKCSGKLVVE